MFGMIAHLLDVVLRRLKQVRHCAPYNSPRSLHPLHVILDYYLKAYIGEEEVWHVRLLVRVLKRAAAS